MGHAITVKGQITIPKAMRDHMGVGHGQVLEFAARPNGEVVMFPAKKTEPGENPFLKWMGTGVSGMTTEEILNETRGEGWNQ